MEAKEQLRQIVAQLAGLKPEAIGIDFSLRSRGLQSSVRRAALAAAIRRHLGVNVPQVYSVVSFSELEAAVLQGESKTTDSGLLPNDLQKRIAASVLSSVDDLACGIDGGEPLR